MDTIFIKVVGKGETHGRTLVAFVAFMLALIGLFGFSESNHIDVIKPDALCIHDTCYVLEHSNVSFGCLLTEHYDSTSDGPNITYDYDNPNSEQLRNETWCVFKNKTLASYQINNVSSEWANTHHRFTVSCYSVHDCLIHELCRDGLTIEVTRKPQHIEFNSASCTVNDWQNMICEWSPTMDEQYEHTQMWGGKEQKELIHQTISWNLTLPNGEEREPMAQNLTDNHFLFVGENFTLGGLVYEIEVKVQALRPQDEHAEITTIIVNTTQIVKPKAVSSMTYDSVTNDSVNVIWTLPDSHGHALTVRINYTCSWKDSNINGCIDSITTLNKTHDTLQDLIPMTKYSVTVELQAPDSIHWSNSTPTTIETKPAVPVKNPRYSTSLFYIASSITCDHDCSRLDCTPDKSCVKATVYWQLLHPSDYYGHGFKYLVEYKPRNAAHFKNITVSSKTSQWEIVFDRDKGLDVRISSRNALGPSRVQQHDVMHIATSGNKPTDLSVYSADATNMTVNWTVQTNQEASNQFLLVWCKRNRNNIVTHHECKSHVSYVPITAHRSNAHYTVTTPVSDLTEEQYKDLLVGVALCPAGEEEHCGVNTGRSKRAAEEQTAGISWTNAMYLDTENSLGHIELTLVNSGDGIEEGSIQATWHYTCPDICRLPTVYKVTWCSPDKRCHEYTTAGQAYKMEDLSVGKTYTVEIHLQDSVNGSWIRMAKQKAAPHESPVLGAGAIAAIVVCAVLFVLALFGVYAFYRYVKSGYKWFHHLPVTLPGQVPRPRRPANSASSRNYIIESQSSDGPQYNRNISQDSSTALLHDQQPAKHRVNGALPTTPEIHDDEVFDDEIAMYTLPSRNGLISHRSCAPDDIGNEFTPTQLQLGILSEEGSGGCFNQDGSPDALDPYNVVTTVPFDPFHLNNPVASPDIFGAFATQRNNAALFAGESSADNSAAPHLPNSKSAPISVHVPPQATENIDSSLNHYNQSMNSLSHSQDFHKKPGFCQAKREPMEHYWTDYPSTPQSKLSPAKLKMFGNVLSAEPRFNSEPHLAEKRVALPDQHKSHDQLNTQKITLLPSGYCSLENNLGNVINSEPKDPKLELKDKPGPRVLDLKRTSHGPVESGVYNVVDLPDKPVFYESDPELEKKQLRKTSIETPVRCDSPYVVPSLDGFVPRDSPEQQPKRLVAKVEPLQSSEGDLYVATALSYEDSATPPDVDEHDYCVTNASKTPSIVSEQNLAGQSDSSEVIPSLGDGVAPLVVQFPEINTSLPETGNEYRPTAVHYDNGLAMRPETEVESDHDDEYCATSMFITNGQVAEV